jgi:hypothetical protein
MISKPRSSGSFTPIRKGRIDRPAGIRLQGPGAGQRRHRPGLQREMRRRPPTARSWPPPSNMSAAGPASCPALSPPTAATARPRSNGTCTPRACASCLFPARPPPPGPQGRRARPRLPHAGQVAHRLRRLDRLPQTQVRLGPHPPGRQVPDSHLVQARDIRPRPCQDRDPSQLTQPSQIPARPKDRRGPGQRLFRAK